jgi:alkyl sulfatase BDS1-like metallo-beta-lactamase superfamily hydrolase
VAATTLDRDFIEAVAGEMASGIHAAVDCWMSKVEDVFNNHHLTTLGRVQKIQDILAEYRRLYGKPELTCQRL